MEIKISQSNEENLVELEKYQNVKKENEDSNDETINIFNNELQDLKEEEFDVKNWKEQIKDFKNIIYLIIMIISIILYYLSLKGCKENGLICLQTFGYKFYLLRAIYVILSSFLYTLLLFLSIKKVIHYYFIIILSIFYIINFLINRGTDLYNHGVFNTIIFLITVLISLLLIYLIFSFFKLIIKKKFLFAIIILIILILPFLFIKLYPTVCNNWKLGLMNKELEGKESLNKNSCYIRQPKKCWLDATKGIFDFTRILGVDCKKNNLNERNILLKYKKNFTNTKWFAYPLTSYYTYNNESFFNVLQKKVINEIYDLETISPELNKSLPIPEVIVNLNEKKVFIKIRKNDTLIEKRKKIYNKEKNKFDNVIFIFIDSLSRRSFYRYFPETEKLLTKYYWDNPKKEKKMNSYQFFKYQNLNPYTDVNLYPMFYGTLYRKYGTNIVNHYKDKGYITAYSQNFCSREIFPIYTFNYKEFNTSFHDHEFISIFCDPNYMNPEDPFSSLDGPYSLTRHCLYGKDSHQYVFDYALEFFKVYKNQPKFLLIGFSDAHEISNEVGKFLDKPLSNFIKNIINQNLNEKNIIFLASDHGNGMPNIHFFLNSEDAYYERTLGTLFLIISDNSNYNKTAIQINEQRLITPYDIHNSLINIINLPKNYTTQDKGIPLWEEIDGMKRSCQTYSEDFIKGALMTLEQGCHCIKN